MTTTTRHVTTMTGGDWSRAGMLRQTAMVRDLGEQVARSYYHVKCAQCDVVSGHETWTEAMDWRVAHEDGPR